MEIILIFNLTLLNFIFFSFPWRKRVKVLSISCIENLNAQLNKGQPRIYQLTFPCNRSSLAPITQGLPSDIGVIGKKEQNGTVKKIVDSTKAVYLMKGLFDSEVSY